MPRSVKISISLPAAIHEAAERERRATGEKRSELFRRALEALLRDRRRKAAVERYVAGYVAEPETAYEVEATDETSRSALAGDPWE